MTPARITWTNPLQATKPASKKGCLMRRQLSAALIALFFVSRALADAGPTTQPAPTPDPEELNHTGAIIVARWDAIIDDKTAAAINSLGSPQPSNSELYDPLLFSASGLRTTLSQAGTHKGILATYRDITFAKSQPGDARLTMGRPFFVQLTIQKPQRIEFQSNMGEYDSFDPPDKNGLHIVLNHPSLHLHVKEQADQPFNQSETAEHAIVYDGHVQPGQALALLGTYTAASGTNYHHLVVYEPFHADGWEQPEISNGGSGITADWWITNGPQKLRQLADIAAVWASRAKHAPDDPPANYSVILDNGAGVRLLGFCNPKQYGFCWWDPNGEPIDAPRHMGLQGLGGRTPYTYAIETRGSTTEPEKPLSSTDEGQSSTDWNLSIQGLRPSHEIQLTLGVGPWKQLGELNQDQPLTIDNITYKLTDTSNDKWLQFMSIQKSVASDDIIDLTLVSKDGKETNSYWIGQSSQGAEVQFAHANNANVKIFHLWLRKSHVVTFTGFALSPNIRPPTSVTRDQVLAAIDKHPTTTPQQ
jgi:hypothetical protein